MLSSVVVDLSTVEQSKHHVLADWIKTKVPDSLVLDVGCGLGFLGHLLGKQYIGIDVCFDAVTLAKKLICRRCSTLVDLPYMRSFIVADMDHLPFRSDTFDCSVFNDSIYYSFNVRRALEDSLRVLKSEGKCVIMHHSQRFIHTIDSVLSFIEELCNSSSLMLTRFGEPFKLLLSFVKK
jgi:ubiquinone/menaquinone biosynthesis C-methylase UbiE